jgi:hypothetical protein
MFWKFTSIGENFRRPGFSSSDGSEKAALSSIAKCEPA